MRRVFRQRSVLIEYSEPRRTLMLSPCSRPSRPSPGGRAKCAALTATALVGGYDVRAGMEGWAPHWPNKRMRSGERREALLATYLQVGACSRLGEMLVIDFDRRPEAVEFARARIELPGDSIQVLLGQT